MMGHFITTEIWSNDQWKPVIINAHAFETIEFAREFEGRPACVVATYRSSDTSSRWDYLNMTWPQAVAAFYAAGTWADAR